MIIIVKFSLSIYKESIDHTLSYKNLFRNFLFVGNMIHYRDMHGIINSDSSDEITKKRKVKKRKDDSNVNS